jgi:RNA polymerase sigma-70 factor (ECF subfamily)
MRYEIVPRTGVNPQDAASNCSGRDTDGVYAHRIGAECLPAFSEIYERYHSKIFRLALRITRNFQDAEDVVQECFMRAFVHMDSFSGKSKLSTWLWRIAINAALMRIRRRRGFDFSLDSFAGTASSARRVDIKCHRPAPDDQYLQREIAQILVEGLAGLSPKLASVVTLRYLEELSTRECAEILGISLSNAKTRILRARLSLHSTFNKRLRRPPVVYCSLR